MEKTVKKIVKKLNSQTNNEEAIEELKSQINPYGNNIDIKNTKYYFMKDGHIWDLLNSEGGIDYKKLTFFIELLLKYDWERSKKEIDSEPYKFIHEVTRLTLLIFSILNIYLVSKNNSLNEILAVINFLMSVLVTLLLVLQKISTSAVISNPSKSGKEKLWIFMIFYCLPYAYIMNSLVDSLQFSEPRVIKTILVMGLFIYEFHYLSLFDSCEDTYVKEIERYSNNKSRQYKKGINLTNQIRDKEEKLYQYEYDISTIDAMTNRLRKIKKKLTKKRRPRDYWLHPILFFQYRKNRKRIIRLVKKLKRKTK